MFPTQHWLISAGVGCPCQLSLVVWWHEARADGDNSAFLECRVPPPSLFCPHPLLLSSARGFHFPCRPQCQKSHLWKLLMAKIYFFTFIFRLPFGFWFTTDRYSTDRKGKKQRPPKVFPVCLYLLCASVHCSRGEVVSSVWAMLQTPETDR